MTVYLIHPLQLQCQSRSLPRSSSFWMVRIMCRDLPGYFQGLVPTTQKAWPSSFSASRTACDDVVSPIWTDSLMSPLPRSCHLKQCSASILTLETIISRECRRPGGEETDQGPDRVRPILVLVPCDSKYFESAVSCARTGSTRVSIAHCLNLGMLHSVWGKLQETPQTYCTYSSRRGT